MNTSSISPNAKKVTDVLVQISEGKSISEACREVGLSRSTYYDFLKKHPEIITEHQDAILGEMKKMLGTTTLEMRRLLEVTIAQAFAEGTSLRDRIALLKFLVDLHEKLMQMDLVDDGEEDLAAAILRTLPPLEYGKNVLEPPDTSDW
jgi:ACT domain-containing protein